MGFDLYGCNATNKKGEYFRNNVWWWRRLWQYIETECSDILSDHEKEAGQWNNGWKIPGPQAKRIAKRLQKSIENKTAEKGEKEIKKAIKKAKTNNKKNKLPSKKYDWNESYPFTVENLKEFIEFAQNSGGFTIN